LRAEEPSDGVLCSELCALGRADGVNVVRRLSGGAVADTWLVTCADGTRMVGKTLPDAAPGLFQSEADGLAVMAATGCVATPRVLAVTRRLLLLEAVAGRDDSERSWEAFADDLAALHRSTAGDRFGWHHDGYLGRLRQINTWTADGHEFFAQHRLLRYLTEPPAEYALTAADRRAVERLCARLPEVIPTMPAVLTHGDLWANNLLSQPGGRITVIDPAVSRTWAEADLSMLWCSPRPAASRRFFARYQELNPSPAGWTARMPLLHLRERLSVIAHFGPNAPRAISHARSTLAPFYVHR
jgi:fructosamine-3-kinase